MKAQDLLYHTQLEFFLFNLDIDYFTISQMAILYQGLFELHEGKVKVEISGHVTRMLDESLYLVTEAFMRPPFGPHMVTGPDLKLKCMQLKKLG